MSGLRLVRPEKRRSAHAFGAAISKATTTQRESPVFFGTQVAPAVWGVMTREGVE